MGSRLSTVSCIVLAGGLGTRMKPVDPTLPKPLLPVAGRPFLEYLLRYLAAAGLRRVVLATGHMAAAIQERFGTRVNLGLQVQFASETAPLGTGGAIRMACHRVRRWPLLVLNGDSFVAVDLSGMLATHRQRRARITVALAQVADTGRFGRVRLDASSAIAAFEEKACTGPGLINAGVYLIEREVVEGIPAGRSSFEREVLPNIIGKGAMGFTTSGFFVDIGVPEDYRRLAEAPNAFLAAVGEGAAG